MSTLGDAADVKPVIKFLSHTLHACGYCTAEVGNPGGTYELPCTVDSTGAFMVAGVATTVVPSCSVSFLSFFLFILFYFFFSTRKAIEKNWLQKFSTFLFLFWAFASAFIYHYSNQGLFLFYIRRKIMFSTV